MSENGATSTFAKRGLLEVAASEIEIIHPKLPFQNINNVSALSKCIYMFLDSTYMFSLCVILDNVAENHC